MTDETTEKRVRTREDKITIAVIFLVFAVLIGGLAFTVLHRRESDTRVDAPATEPDTAAVTPSEAPSTSASSSSSVLPPIRHWESDGPAWQSFEADIASVKSAPGIRVEDDVVGTAQTICMAIDQGIDRQTVEGFMVIDDVTWDSSTSSVWIAAADRWLC